MKSQLPGLTAWRSTDDDLHRYLEVQFRCAAAWSVGAEIGQGAMGGQSLPANVLTLLAILQARGPLTQAELTAALASAGVVIPAHVLHKLPTRYPRDLAVLPDGRWALVTTDSDTTPGEEPVAPVGARQRVGRDQVLVVHHERVGPEEITLSTLDGVERGRWPVAEDASVGPALDEIEKICRASSTKLVICAEGNPVEVLLSRMPPATGTTTGAILADLPVADVAYLSVLVAPDADHRSVDALETVLGLAEDPGWVGARRVARLAAALLERVDLEEPSWALAIAALAAGGSPWSAVLPEAIDPDLTRALIPWPDPLLDAAAGTTAFTVRRGIENAVPVLASAAQVQVRPQQQEMAFAIADAFDRGGDLAVEAPTGTGKTLAYLLPASVRSTTAGAATVIATHTKVLQRQVRREVQRLRDAGLFAPPFRQLFGVNNYICTRETADSCESLLDPEAGTSSRRREDVHDRRASAEAAAVAVRALAVAHNGVWDDVTDLAARRGSRAYLAARMRLVTDSSECEATQCSWSHACPLMIRRKDLDRRPGVISTNHAVIATWAANPAGAPSVVLSDEDGGAVVFDEAHQLEDSLTTAWTEEVASAAMTALLTDLGGSRGRVARVGRAMRNASLDTAPVDRLAELAATGRRALADLDTAVTAYVHEYAGREGRTELRPGLVDARVEFAKVRDAAVRLARQLGASLEPLQTAAAAIQERGADGPGTAELRRSWRTLRFLHRRCSEQQELLQALIDLRHGHRAVYLLDVEAAVAETARRPRPWRFQRVPVEIGDRFRTLVQKRTSSLVLTSATLRVAGTFRYLLGRLGLTEAPAEEAGRPVATLALSSPFDFDRQSMVVLTSHLPVPVPVNEDEFCEAAAADTVGFLSLSRGRTLSLFAARARMTKVVDGVRRRERELAERGVSLLVQGEHSPAEIQARFRSQPGTVLFGLRSYWEGFDAPGETLSFLQVEKAPYPPPDDPLVRARCRVITDQGGNAFLDYVVPRTAIALAQGFGRLIRTTDDRGVALLLDRRLQHPTSANDVLLSSLPSRNVHLALDRDDAWRSALQFVDDAEPTSPRLWTLRPPRSRNCSATWRSTWTHRWRPSSNAQRGNCSASRDSTPNSSSSWSPRSKGATPSASSRPARASR